MLIHKGSVKVDLKVDTQDSLVALICGDHPSSIVTLHVAYTSCFMTRTTSIHLMYVASYVITQQMYNYTIN